MGHNIRINIDLYRDWIEILRGELKDSPLDFCVSLGREPDVLCRQYFNLLRRLILPVPRDIQVSRELSFPPEYEKRIEEVWEKARVGKNLNPHLSKKICNLNYEDTLLNACGVYHLHLGEEREDDFFVERKGPLLFARLDMGCAYCIDVVDHEEWSEEDIMEIARRNWPDIFTGKGLKEAGGTGKDADEDALCEYYKEHLRKKEECVREDISKYIRSIKNAGYEPQEELSFSLMEEEGKIYICEVNSGVRFRQEGLSFPHLSPYFKNL